VITALLVTIAIVLALSVYFLLKADIRAALIIALIRIVKVLP